MIRHIVMYKLRDDCDKQKAIAEVKNSLEQLVGTALGLVTMQIRPTFSGEYDYVLDSEFADRESLEGYKVHPAHLAVKPLVHGYITERVGADTEI